MQVKFMIIAVALLSAIAFSSHGQSVDNLTGAWELSAEAFFGAVKGEGGDCRFAGNANITQTDGTFTGNAAMTLVSGSQGCPAEMGAQIEGNVVRGAILMSMLMGPLGTAQFDGQTTQKGSPVGGTFSVTSGSFAGATGTWLGTPSARIVPTAGVWGLASLMLLLLAAGALYLRRGPRHGQAAS